MKFISFSQIKLFLGAALFFCLTLWLVKPVEKKRSEYIPPPLAMKNLTVGMNFAWADSLWLRALQDFDYCEQKVNEVECKSRSWLYQTINLATEIDPVFEVTMYRAAGLALSVIVSDYAGATAIFDKAIVHYPKNWELIYAAAYHAYYEEKNKLKAARLYEQAGHNGAPTWVLSFAGKLALEGGSAEYSKKILEGMIATNTDEKIINRLREKIEKLESQKK